MLSGRRSTNWKVDINFAQRPHRPWWVSRRPHFYFPCFINVKSPAADRIWNQWPREISRLCAFTVRGISHFVSAGSAVPKGSIHHDTLRLVSLACNFMESLLTRHEKSTWVCLAPGTRLITNATAKLHWLQYPSGNTAVFLSPRFLWLACEILHQINGWLKFAFLATRRYNCPQSIVKAVFFFLLWFTM